MHRTSTFAGHAETKDMWNVLSRYQRSQQLLVAAYLCLRLWGQVAGAPPRSQDLAPASGRHLQEQDDGLSSSIRHLNDVVDEPVLVSTPRELEAAILQGRHHIVVTAHLDLTSLPLRSTTVCAGCESPVPEIGDAMSIRGQCTAPPDSLDTASLVFTPGAADLLPFQDRQCLIMIRKDLFIMSNRIWLDNLYLRAVYHAPNDRKLHFMGLAGFPPLKGQGKYFITRSTFQGDSLGLANGVWADEATYIENCTFANLGGDGSNNAACRDCTGNVNAAGAPVRIVNSTFFDPVRANFTNYVRAWGGGSVLMTGCSFAVPSDITYPLFYAREGSTIYTDDASVRVRSDSGPAVAATPIADASNSMSDFLNRSDLWLVSVMDSQQEAVQPRPAYPAPLAPVLRLQPAVESNASAAATAAVSGEPVDIARGQVSTPETSRQPGPGPPPVANTVVAAIVSSAVAAALLVICIVVAVRRCQRQRRGSVEELKSGITSGRACGTRNLTPDYERLRNRSQTGAGLQNVSMHLAPALTAQDRVALEAATDQEVHQVRYADLSVQFGGTARRCTTYPLESSTHWATSTTTVDFDKPLASSATPHSSKIDFLHTQLSSIGRHEVLLERFVLLGPNNTRQGGQGVVAFAKGVHNDLAYALKFFLDRAAFLAERDLYRSQALGKLLPQIQAEYDPQETPSSHVLKDRAGRLLPPCIVMERGESLPDWSRRAKPDVFQSVAVLAHVATRLRDLHESGYAHRDVKPENLMFLPRENRWTVIDFGCAAAVGEVAALAYTLVYAAPEVAAAVAAGVKTVAVDPAVDAWALGVVAFELLTGQSAFNLVTEGRDSVLGKLLGAEELPWEGDLAEKNPAARRRLGLFREPVLSLLRRDPAQRATLAEFCCTTNSVFSSPTTVERP